MTRSQLFIVGRQRQVDHFAALVTGQTDHSLLNMYGPGGIGKTIVCHQLAAYARQINLPCARVDGSGQDMTPDRLLDEVKASLADHQVFAESFSRFEQQFQEYQAVNRVLSGGGGVHAMFDVVGNIKDRAGFEQLIGGLGQTITGQIRQIMSNRFPLDRYLRGIEKSLTTSLCTGLAAGMEQVGQPVALLIDTYEDMEEKLDNWVCHKFIPALPPGIKVVVFGRNVLPKVNFDWSDFGDTLHTMQLPELEEQDAKRYLIHHGLRDAAALDKIYHFTGGYPLLLVLVMHLAREAGGWDKIGGFASEGDRDRVATQLLERILREERAREVREFLEKGCIARWFNAEIISVLLQISLGEARRIYDKLQRHSFVERHPRGLKFHDKIRELLDARLQFTSGAEYQRLKQRLKAYYADKAGLDQSEMYTVAEPPEVAEAQPPATGEQEQRPVQSIPNHPFGNLIRQFLTRKQGLSQKRLAEGIDQGDAVISAMGRGKRLTGKGARPRVLAIIGWLYRQGVLTTRPEANALLDAAGMAPLQPDAASADEQWLCRVLQDSII